MDNKKFLISLLFVFYCSSSRAQQPSIYPIVAMEVQAFPSDTAGEANGASMLTDSTLFTVHMLISLFDTAGIAAVHVKLGRTDGLYDLVQTRIPFNSIVPDGNNVDIQLGEFKGLLIFYSEARIEKSDGSFSSIVKFSNR